MVGNRKLQTCVTSLKTVYQVLLCLALAFFFTSYHQTSLFIARNRERSYKPPYSMRSSVGSSLLSLTYESASFSLFKVSFGRSKECLDLLFLQADPKNILMRP